MPHASAAIPAPQGPPPPSRRTPVARGLLVLLVAAACPVGASAAPGPVPEGSAMAWPTLPPGTPVRPHRPEVPPRPVLLPTAPATIEVDRERRLIRFTAEARPSAFRGSTGPDDQYHALVSRAGGAADKSLMVTDAADHQVAEALRSLGAEDGGGVPMSAWNRRAIPFVPGPGSKVQGSRVQVLITWEGADRSYTLEELLGDAGGGEVEIRFGGNEEHDHHWPSGCIICLYSCPGGVLSNARKTIRDHSRGHAFTPGDLFPPDGTPLTITLQLLPA